MALLEGILRGISKGLERERERGAEKRKAQEAKELLQFEYGLREPERRLARERLTAEQELAQRQLKERAVENAYTVAREAATSYLENPDADDKTPALTARAIAASTFDNYMSSAGFPDITFLKEIKPEREEIEAPAPIPAREPIIPPTRLPAEAPTVQKIAEYPGRAIRGVPEALRRGTEAATKIRQDIMKGIYTGLTGEALPEPRGAEIERPAIEPQKELLNLLMSPASSAFFLGETAYQEMQRRRRLRQPAETRIEKRIIR